MVKRSAGRKHESAGQPNQSTCLILYRNEVVPPLHDTLEKADRFRSGLKFRTGATTGMNLFRNQGSTYKFLATSIFLLVA